MNAKNQQKENNISILIIQIIFFIINIFITCFAIVFYILKTFLTMIKCNKIEVGIIEYIQSKMLILDEEDKPKTSKRNYNSNKYTKDVSLGRKLSRYTRKYSYNIQYKIKNSIRNQKNKKLNKTDYTNNIVTTNENINKKISNNNTSKKSTTEIKRNNSSTSGKKIANKLLILIPSVIGISVIILVVYIISSIANEKELSQEMLSRAQSNEMSSEVLSLDSTSEDATSIYILDAATMKDDAIYAELGISKVEYEKIQEEKAIQIAENCIVEEPIEIIDESSSNYTIEGVDTNILLHKGDSNNEVIKIQEILMDLHYMDSDEPTDYYGTNTEYAMQLFQREHGLSVDGITGLATLKVLYSDEVVPYNVRVGDKGSDIERIQKRLKNLGYLESDKVDSRFTEETQKAVINFQDRNKLSADGIVGYNTNQVLFDEDAKAARSSYATGGYGDTSSTPVESNVEGESSASDNSSSDDSSSSDSGSSSEGSNASYNASKGEKLVAFAKTLKDQGIPYVWGGKTIAGLDCSGYVYYCLNNSGVGSYGYKTSSSWATSAYTTIGSISDLKPGDVACFRGHVGIYIGGGYMIDMSSSRDTIRTTNIASSTYWSGKWVTGKRIFN